MDDHAGGGTHGACAPLANNGGEIEPGDRICCSIREPSVTEAPTCLRSLFRRSWSRSW
ncbi:MAG: hypothetical protein ACLUFI_10750 [Oscillospiraceae bacterium]